jgi:8-amino-7-oxononanoate synthase
MDGDVAPVRELAVLAQRHDAWLMLDDAHGFAVLGSGGRGTLEVLGLQAGSVPILIGTLGKALGSFGAFVAGEAALIETLLQRARTYIYTTALPPAIAAATRAALRLAQAEPWRREHLARLVQRFRTGAAVRGLPLMSSSTPIQPLLIGDSGQALALSAALEARGFWVSAIRPPTVPRGGARLRITLSAAHRERDVDALLEALASLFAQRSVA